MRRAVAVAPPPGVVVGVGLTLVAIYVGITLRLMGTNTYDVWAAIIVGPLLFLLSLPILARQARREGDPRVFWLLALALALKLIASIARYYVAFDLYGGQADAGVYHGDGARISANFRAGIFETGFDSLTKSNFISFLTGIVYTVIRPTKLGGFMVFSWFGYLGLFLFYRAFTIAVPEGRARSYARVLFFLPSLLFWPSSLGKESWMMLSLGIGAYGVARVLTGETMRGLAVTVLGLWLAGIVRPHVSGLMAVALAAAFLVRKPHQRWRHLGPVVKVLSAAVVGVVAVVAVLKAEDFLKKSGVDTGQGLQGALAGVTARTAQGGSNFVPSILDSPARAPMALATVLFRPSVLDAHNAQAFVAALEGMFLLLFSLAKVRWVVAAVRSIRRQPYVAFALAYTGLFVFAFSSIANFGLLVRERVQLWPLYFVLFSVAPARKVADDSDSGLVEAKLPAKTRGAIET